MSPLTTHVLDTARGLPAPGLSLRVEARAADGSFRELARATTNADGRAPDLLAEGALGAGVYRIVFDTGAWYASRGERSFYPEVTILFEVTEPARHHHVPLLLSPFGYSTYRGS
ncbi:MAG: hydroxyisourate hydrolase [Deltaproteobacteria bacterium]|nr:hydroxyisourate hydrolase [Deltaproteobacteria bacterium]MCB9788489.1 hydroxyisourate hydrolase [Deltaproteobacteria bacterium]